MKVLSPGHKYELAGFEGPSGKQIVQFIQKRPAGPSRALITVKDGTTNEEILRALIDRLKWLNKKLPSVETLAALTCCESALAWLEKRTTDRVARGVEGKSAK